MLRNNVSRLLKNKGKLIKVMLCLKVLWISVLKGISRSNAFQTGVEQYETHSQVF
jgi:hypothetical protein